MSRSSVSVTRYEKPLDSVRRAIEAVDGLAGLTPETRVFIKPNVVFWTKAVDFPRYGVITTSRVVEDVVVLLKELGVERIAIGEGIVSVKPNDRDTHKHAFDYLGYYKLAERFGVEVINIWERPFDPVDLGDGFEVRANRDFLEADFVVNLPVLKAHAQTMVSLGNKNLKGMLDMESRKVCHNADPERSLHRHVSRFHRMAPRSLTLIDGIYSLERGPGFDGKAHRTNLLVASTDVLAADMVGATLLGHDPAGVPHLIEAAQGRSLDIDELEIIGEDPRELAVFHAYEFPYANDDTLPAGLVRIGIEGLSYPKYDDTICTYCSVINGILLTSIAQAWQGEPWNEVEVLTGKMMKPDPKKKTLLLGKCLSQLYGEREDLGELVSVKGCPPPAKAVVKAVHKLGIPIEPGLFENMELTPAFFLRRYQGKEEFDDKFFRVE